MLRCATYILLFIFLNIDVAFSDSSALFSSPQMKLIETFKSTKNIIYITGGMGLVGISFLAIFGKIQWKWFAALCIGVFVVSIAGAIIDYMIEN